MVPLHKKVSNGSAPKNTAQISAMTTMTVAMVTAAAAGVSLAPVLARRCSGAASRATANNSRDAPTTQARQHPKALMLAPSVTRSPTQLPMYDVPRSPISAGDAMKFLMPWASVPNAIISMAVTTVK